jgi:hypothetical protein
MTENQPSAAVPGQVVAVNAHDVKVQQTPAVEGREFESRIYKAISVQRPVVLEYVKSLRREKPDASPAELLRVLEKRYVTTVTMTGTGVGMSAALPAVGIGISLGLGAVDLVFFYETSALYVLAAAELHGIEVHDVERARPLVYGVLLGEKSQSKINKMVLTAAGAGGVDQARAVAGGTVGKVLPNGWGDVLTQQLPDSALAPLSTVLAKQALKSSAKFGAGTLGKVIPFGVGAIVGGVGSYTFGRDIVKAARLAFPAPPADFPDALRDFSKPEQGLIKSSRAAQALQSAAHTVVDAGGATWRGGTRLAGSVGSRLKRKSTADDSREAQG